MGRERERLLVPLVGRSDVVIGKKRRAIKSIKIVDIPDASYPEARVNLASLEEKALLAKSFELQVRGHRRRPDKAPRRTAQEGEAKARVKAVKEGVEHQTITDQIIQWLEEESLGSLTLSPEIPQNQPPITVFIAGRDLREIGRIFGNIRRIELDTADEAPDPEIMELLDEDQSIYGQSAANSTETDPIQPRLKGPAIHWVEKPDTSELT